MYTHTYTDTYIFICKYSDLELGRPWIFTKILTKMRMPLNNHEKYHNLFTSG